MGNTASTAINDPQSVFGGVTYWDQNSGASDALSVLPGGTLRFEVDPGSMWRLDAPNVERSEIASWQQVSNGTAVEASYTLTVQQGSATADPNAWVVLGQFHQDNNAHAGSPPFALTLVGGKMAVQIAFTDASGNDIVQRLWTDSSPIVQGAPYAMDVKATFDPNGNGHLVVTRNGATLVNYSGPLGYASQTSVYWKEGIYRSAASTSMIADYSNTAVTIGTPSSASVMPAAIAATAPAPANAPAAAVLAAAQPATSAGTVGTEIALLYQVTLGRAADPQGLASYLGNVANGSSLVTAAGNMAGSGEALARYGSQTNAQFVSQLFSNAYGAAANSANNVAFASQLADQLGRGTISRGEVAVGVALGSQHLQAAGVTLAGGLIDPALTGTVTTDPHSAGGTAELVALTLLGTAPTGLDLEAGAQTIANGGGAGDVAAQLLSGSASGLSGLSDTQFIDAIYANALGRTPDAGGLANYQAQLAGGTSRATVAADVALSQEHINNVQGTLGQGVSVPSAADSALTRLYYGILGRAPDIWGLLSDSHLAQGSNTLNDRANAMLGSTEYSNRFGQMSDTAFVSSLYQNALGRTPDAGGLGNYTGLLAGGTSRAGVALDIAESQEATRHLAPQIENGFHFA